MATKKATDLGVISVDSVYPLTLFMRLTGLKRWSMRTARRKGLLVISANGRRYVRGKDWLRYLDSLAEEQGGQVATT